VHGTRYEHHEGRLARVIDRTGAVHAELVWDAPSGAKTGQLVRLAVANAVVHGEVFAHPLLGPAHAVGDTAMTALAWARPTEIPAIAEPGRLPFGAGGAILNAISLLAQHAGVPSLRYAGPYPTAALWRTLARSFDCAASEAAFTEGALDRALRVARDPIAIDFTPAPHVRIALPGGFVELRDRIERVALGGVSYEPGGSPARLVATDGGELHCEIWFGDAPYARIATLVVDGALRDGPHAIPPCESPVIGSAFPPALRAAIAELVAEAVPAPLAAPARALCTEQPLAWADLGPRAARELPGGFAVHAALWDRIAPLGLARLALALVEALAPVVAAAVVQRAAAELPDRA
jgi:hypothetical protein